MTANITSIINGFSNLFLYQFDRYLKLGIFTEQEVYALKQRTEACKKCPLRNGSWCSRKKNIQVIQHQNKSLFRKNKTGLVSGCGCFIPAKKFTNSHCPLQQWIEL